MANQRAGLQHNCPSSSSLPARRPPVNGANKQTHMHKQTGRHAGSWYIYELVRCSVTHLTPSPRTAPRLGSWTVTASESGARKGTAWLAGMGSSEAPLFLCEPKHSTFGNQRGGLAPCYLDAECGQHAIGLLSAWLAKFSSMLAWAGWSRLPQRPPGPSWAAGPSAPAGEGIKSAVLVHPAPPFCMSTKHYVLTEKVTGRPWHVAWPSKLCRSDLSMHSGGLPACPPHTPHVPAARAGPAEHTAGPTARTCKEVRPTAASTLGRWRQVQSGTEVHHAA